MHRLRGNSTETALLRVWSDMLMAANERRLTVLCMLDMSDCGVQLCRPLDHAAPSKGWRRVGLLLASYSTVLRRF